MLGVVQGLTEFLPISSSAHLRITAAVAGWGDPGAAFTAVTQLGTEFAVLLYFRDDISRILLAWFRSIRNPRWRRHPDARMGWLLIVGSIPIGVLGLLFEEQITHAFRDLRLTAATLIGFGVLLGWADRVGTKKLQLGDLNVRDGVLYGLAQSLALIPGVSRSGGTTTAGLLLGYSREAAARYGFLLAVPAVFASGLYKLADIGAGGGPAWGPVALATLISFAVGLAVVAWLMDYIKRGSFMPFVVYRVVLGLFLLALIFTGVLDPNAGPDI